MLLQLPVLHLKLHRHLNMIQSLIPLTMTVPVIRTKTVPLTNNCNLFPEVKDAVQVETTQELQSCEETTVEVKEDPEVSIFPNQ